MEHIFGGDQHSPKGKMRGNIGRAGKLEDGNSAPDTVFPLDSELSNQRMKELVRLVRLGREDPQVFASKAHMRAVVAEVVSIPPSQLYQSMANSLIWTSDTMCLRGYNYVHQNIEARVDLPADVKEQHLVNLKVEWENFAHLMRQNIEAQLPALEELIFDKIYTLDQDMFTNGYIRLPHQQGIDCTDLEGAKAMEKTVSTHEERLETAYGKRAALIKKKQLIQRNREETREMLEHIERMQEVIERKVVPLKEQYGVPQTAAIKQEIGEDGDMKT